MTRNKLQPETEWGRKPVTPGDLSCVARVLQTAISDIAHLRACCGGTFDCLRDHIVVLESEAGVQRERIAYLEAKVAVKEARRAKERQL